ncbi:MAG TPA: cupin domain-containing protein [Gemmatimonadaceae bacterium]|nr:cupin domain-containing protein [Gemmatimonadaceae bacterium]
MSAAKTAGAVVVRAGEGQAVRWGPAGVVRVVAGADSTDGSFSIVEVKEPAGSFAPLHTHRGEAEAFYILEGKIELTCGDETVTAGAGDFVYTPRGVAHKYVVTGDQAARVLLFFSRPGFESFFLDGGAPLDRAPSGPPKPEDLQRLFDKYDLEVHESMAH